MFFPQVSHVIKFTGLSEQRVAVSSLLEGDVFKIEANGPWYRATCDALASSATAGGYLVEMVLQEFLQEGM